MAHNRLPAPEIVAGGNCLLACALDLSTKLDVAAAWRCVSADRTSEHVHNALGIGRNRK